MKKLLYLLLTVTLFSSCVKQKDVDHAKNVVMAGKHELRKFNVKSSNIKESSASYFLIMGSFSSKETNDVKVRFYFLNYKGEYQFAESPLTNITIRIENVVVPYITFDYSDPNYVADKFVPSTEVSTVSRYVSKGYFKIIIHCKESDFQPDININDLK